jgi:uncharacterized protein YdaU (DUF1376 family)
MNYFEDHIGDYAAATAHLSWDEDMAYTRLIRAYYHAEKPIPKDKAHRLARATTTAQRRAVDAVLDEFFVLESDGYHQKRCDEEIARFMDKQEKAKRSADARWNAHRAQSERNANASADAMRTHSEGNAPSLQSPDTRHQTPEKERVRTARASRLPADFDMPDAWAEWCEKNRPDLVPREVFEKFRDYWAAKPGKAGTKLDWLATWRNWCREEKQRAPPQRPAESFRERDERQARARFEEATGQRSTPDNVIDITPTKPLELTA